MGCHTWYYKHYEVDASFEEIQRGVLTYYEDGLIEMTDPTHEYYWIYEDYGEQRLKDTIAIQERTIRRIKNGYCKEAVRNRYTFVLEDIERSKFKGTDAHKASLFFYSKGKYYKDIDSEFTNGFRVFGYPETILRSYKETIDFILNNDKVYFRNSILESSEEVLYNRHRAVNRIKEFWDKYPKGIIRFG